jgi:hypothetical protein
VENADRLVEQFREGDQAVEGLDLGRLGVADGMVFRRGVAALHQALAHPFQQAVILGMDADQRPGRARRHQDVEQLPVIDLHGVIGHEDLDRAMPGADQRRQILRDGLLVGVRHHQVEGVVDDRALLGQGRVILDHAGEVGAAMLGGEGNH